MNLTPIRAKPLHISFLRLESKRQRHLLTYSGKYMGQQMARVNLNGGADLINDQFCNFIL